MKILALSSEDRVPDYSCVYKQLGGFLELEVKILSKVEQQNLDRLFKTLDLSVFDRILIDLRFKYIYRQVSVLNRYSNIVIYAQDACQNYIENSRWYGQFSAFHKAVPNARLIVTGFEVAERLRAESLNVDFIVKGYDPDLVFYEETVRDIELGFIGRTASKAYKDRKELLEKLELEDGLKVIRTEQGVPYRKMLNRIRYFVSADIGLGEYMAKNFEAMACGCVLLAWRQGKDEAAIGLEDGVHLLLYSSIKELREHIRKLRDNPIWASQIAENGRRFAEQNLTHRHLAEKLYVALQKPLIEVSPKTSARKRLRLWFFRQ